MTVALSVDAPRSVRHSFDQFAGTVDEALLDDLRILSSEIVTNAVTHSGQPEGDPIEVITTFSPDAVRVEIIDNGPGVTSLQPRSITPPSGLQYVQLLSDRWSSHTGSFHVWFEIDTETDELIRRKAWPDGQVAHKGTQ